MFTNVRFPVFTLTGDWKEDGPRLLEAINRYLLSLENKDALEIGAWKKWTPTLIGSTTAGTQTYTQQAGQIAHVGSGTHLIKGYIEISAKGGTIAGNVLVGGIPIKSNSVAIYGGFAIGGYDNINLTAGYSQLGLQINGASANQLRLYESGDNVASQAVAVAALSANGAGTNTAITFAGFIFS